MATIERLEDIQAWQRARELTRLVFRVTSIGAFKYKTPVQTGDVGPAGFGFEEDDMIPPS